MAKTYSVAEARGHFSNLLDRAAAGEGIVITRSGKPLVRLVAAARRQPGTARHWRIPDDLFLEPTPDDEIDEIGAREGESADERGISRPPARE